MNAAPSFSSRVFLHFHSPLVLSTMVLCEVVGGLGLMMPGAPGMMWLTTLLLAAVGVGGLIRLIGVVDFATPWSVLAVSYALGYGLGSFNTLASGYSSGLDLLALTYAPDEYVTQVVAGLLMLCGLMLLVGELDQRKLVPSLQMDDDLRQTLLIALGLTFLFSVLAVVTGQLGFQGDMKAEEGSNRVSVLGNLMGSAMSPLVAAGLFASRGMKGRDKWLTYLFVLGLMLILVTQGRRILLYTAVMGAMGYFGPQGLKAIFKGKNLMVLVVAILLVALGTKMFFAMRQANYELPKDASIADSVTLAVKKMTGDNSADLDEKLKENRATRTFILGYASEILWGLETHNPVGGDLLVMGVAAAVPTVIWPGKWKIMAWGSEENICNPQLGLPAYDAANSLMTAGLCDFGWWGFVTYPLIFPLIFSISLIFVRRLNLVARLVFGYGLVNALLNAENVTTSYLVIIRNEVIIMIGIVVLHRMVLAWRRRNRLYAAAH